MDNESTLQLLSKGDFRKDVISQAILLKGEWQRRLFGLARNKLIEYFPSGAVEVRSVVEISNICQRKCNFCNINFYSRNKKRYTIKYEDLIRIVGHIYHTKKRKIFLLQSGENKSQRYIDFISKSISGIKQKFHDLTIILCLGSLNYSQYKQLRESGADRYILKFETSNPKIYKQIKPDDSLELRIECLKMLSAIGFDVGTGNIVGLPNQTIEDIVNDLFFISNFELTMISASVFIPGEASNFKNIPAGDPNIALNYMALMRILYPQMLIPSTSSLEKSKKGGQYLGLITGANAVTVHDGTPEELKGYFPIYSVRRFTPDEKHIKSIITKSHLCSRKQPANNKAGLQLIN